MPTQVGDEHAKIEAQKFDERVKHRAGSHKAVQEKQRLTAAYNLIEDPVRRAVFPGLAGGFPMFDLSRFGAEVTIVNCKSRSSYRTGCRAASISG